MNTSRTLEPWALFVDDCPPVTAVEPQHEAPGSAPHARVELLAVDADRGAFLILGAAAAAVALLIGGLVMAEVDSAAGVGAWATAVIAAVSGTVWALWNRVTRRPAEYELDDRGIARRLRWPNRADEVTLIRWDEVTFYRDTQDIDRAALLAVGRNGARIWLHEANPSERTQQFIREFVEYAEHRSPLKVRSSLHSAGDGMKVVGLSGLLLVSWFLLAQLPFVTLSVAQHAATGIVLLLIFLVHSYVVLTDDDRAYEDRRSQAWDAQLRDSVRRLLRIEAE